MTTAVVASDDLFTTWQDRSPARSRVRGRHPAGTTAGLRFAFSWRISTDGYQDPAPPRQWQHDQACCERTPSRSSEPVSAPEVYEEGAGQSYHDHTAGQEAGVVPESGIGNVLPVEPGDRGRHGDDRRPGGELPGDLVELRALLVELGVGHPVDA